MKKIVYIIGTLFSLVVIIIGGICLMKDNKYKNNTEQETNIITTTVSIEKNDKKSLSEKKIVNFGDSIIGMIRDDTSISGKIHQQIGSTTYNVGFGGTYAALGTKLDKRDYFSFTRLITEIVKEDTDTSKWQEQTLALKDTNWSARRDYYVDSLKILQTTDFNDIDIITISYGTNDFASSIPIQGTDDNTFIGALSNSIDLFNKKFPNTEIYLTSPLYRYWQDSNGDFLIDSNSKEINNNKLGDFSSAIEEVAKMKHVHYINNSTVINFENKEKNFPTNDSLHPNQYGRELVAQNISKAIEK